MRTPQDIPYNVVDGQPSAVSRQPQRSENRSVLQVFSRSVSEAANRTARRLRLRTPSFAPFLPNSSPARRRSPPSLAPPDPHPSRPSPSKHESPHGRTPREPGLCPPWLSRASLILKQPRSDLCSRTPIPSPAQAGAWGGLGMDEAADSSALLRRVEELQHGNLWSSALLVAMFCVIDCFCYSGSVLVYSFFVVGGLVDVCAKLGYPVSCGPCKISFPRPIQTT